MQDVAPEERNVMLSVRISEREMAMIRELAEHQGLSQSDVVRQLVRREHASVFGVKPKR